MFQKLNEALSYCSLVSNKDLKFPHNSLIQCVGYLLQNSEDALKLTFYKKDTVSKIKNKKQKPYSSSSYLRYDMPKGGKSLISNWP